MHTERHVVHFTSFLNLGVELLNCVDWSEGHVKLGASLLVVLFAPHHWSLRGLSEVGKSRILPFDVKYITFHRKCFCSFVHEQCLAGDTNSSWIFSLAIRSARTSGFPMLKAIYQGKSPIIFQRLKFWTLQFLGPLSSVASVSNFEIMEWIIFRTSCNALKSKNDVWFISLGNTLLNLLIRDWGASCPLFNNKEHGKPL